MLRLTTSWDDGDVLDLRVAALLDKHDVTGTFYITKIYRERRLSEEEIRDLSSRYEVGAHTLTHPDLRTLRRGEKKQEIAGSKEWLENITGKTVSSFCYPRGRFDDECVAVVKEAGFAKARTIEQGALGGTDPFRMPTTLQIYPFPLRGTSLQPLAQRFGILRRLGVPLWCMSSWQSAARAAFDQALHRGGVFHLWGHSWEVDDYGMWEELDAFLGYACSRL
jgi:peptidoglycan-N-acetylglucosamine deacetylase